MRIHFIVRVFDIRIHLESKTSIISDPETQSHARTFDLDLDFAKYKKIVFSQWIPDAPSSKLSREEIWKETSHPKHSPLFFRYRTDYAPLLEPKELKIQLFANKLPIGSVVLSLHTLATGPEEYHLHLTLDQDNKGYSKATVFLICQMHQECVMQYKISSMVCPRIPLPAVVARHPNSFWFDPDFSVDVWYVSLERMTFAIRQKGELQRQQIAWVSSPPFYVSDTTDMLENAHFFLQISYNDRPLGYALVPLFRDFDPEHVSGEFRFQVPVFMYYSSSVPLQPVGLNLVIQITQGPLFWPMKNGITTESLILSGTYKPHFPRPKLPEIASQKTDDVNHHWGAQEIVKTLERSAFPVSEFAVHSGADQPSSAPSELILYHLDDSQKALLESYFNLGFSKDWTQSHIAELIESGCCETRRS